MTAISSTLTFVGPEGGVRTAPAAPLPVRPGACLDAVSETVLLAPVQPAPGTWGAGRAQPNISMRFERGPLVAAAVAAQPRPPTVREERFLPRAEERSYDARHAAKASNALVLLVGAIVVGLIVALAGVALLRPTAPRSTYTDGTPVTSTR